MSSFTFFSLVFYVPTDSNLLSKFFQYFMYQPQHLPCFKIFFCVLCTNRSPSPVDFSFAETSADPHHITDTPHQSTPAPPHTRRCIPTPPSALPYSQPYHRTTVPPYLSPALQAHHCKYNMPHSQTYHHTTIPHNHAVPLHRTIAPHSQTYDLLTTQLHNSDPRRPSRRRTDAAPPRPARASPPGPRRRCDADATRRRWNAVATQA